VASDSGVGGAVLMAVKSDSQHGYTALIWAADKGHADCLGFLIDAGADKDAKTIVRVGRCFAEALSHLIIIPLVIYLLSSGAEKRIFLEIIPDIDPSTSHNNIYIYIYTHMHRCFSLSLSQNMCSTIIFSSYFVICFASFSQFDSLKSGFCFELPSYFLCEWSNKKIV
jgi:hypothetical protein